MRNLIEYFAEQNRPTSVRIFRVKFTTSVIVPDDIGGVTTSTINEVRDLPESTVANLRGSVEILGEVVAGVLAEKRRRIDPTASIPPAMKAPESYKQLPAEFGELFDLSERYRVLSSNKNAWTRLVGQLGAGDPDRAFYERKQGEADAAFASLDVNKIGRLQFRASSVTLKAIEQANEARAELEKIGFELFALRAHGLGLAQWQLARAFSGSALHARFVREGVHVGGVRQAYIGGQMQQYLDAPLPQTVWHYERAKTLKAECEKLLVEAKKELTAAKKTFGKELVAA